MPGRTIMKDLTDRWEYSENAFYATVATMVRSGEVEARKGAGASKVYRLVMS